MKLQNTNRIFKETPYNAIKALVTDLPCGSHCLNHINGALANNSAKVIDIENIQIKHNGVQVISIKADAKVMVWIEHKGSFEQINKNFSYAYKNGKYKVSF